MGIQSHFPPLGVQSHHFPSQAFRVIGLQSHHIFSLTFKVVFFSLGVQSHQAFKAIFIFFQFNVHNPFFQFGIQSHYSVQAFRPTIFSLDVQSHFFQFRRLEPTSIVQVFRVTFLNQAFRATFFNLGIQSHLTQLRRSEPPFSHQRSKPQAFKDIGIQNHSSHRHSKPPLSFIGVRATCIQNHFLSQAFKATILGFQSHHFLRRSKPFPSQAFRATGVQGHSSHWRSEPLFSLAFKSISFIGIQSHHFHRSSKSFPLKAFKATSLQIHSSHRRLELSFHGHSEPFLSQVFKVIFLTRSLEPLCLVPLSLVQAFKAILLSLGLQSHLAQFRPSKPPLSVQAFRVVVFQSLSSSILCVIQFIELITCVLIVSLVPLTSCPCIEQMQFSFCMCLFVCSLVVWLLLDFNINFRVTFGDISKGVWIHSVTLEAPQEFSFLPFLQGVRVFLFLFWFKSARVILEQIWWSFLFFGRAHFISLVYALTLLVDSTEEGHICKPQNLSQF